MTKADVARKLLALGPLSPSEFREITGWSARFCAFMLQYLRDRGDIRRVHGAYEAAR